MPSDNQGIKCKYDEVEEICTCRITMKLPYYAEPGCQYKKPESKSWIAYLLCHHFLITAAKTFAIYIGCLVPERSMEPLTVVEAEVSIYDLPQFSHRPIIAKVDALVL